MHKKLSIMLTFLVTLGSVPAVAYQSKTCKDPEGESGERTFTFSFNEPEHKREHVKPIKVEGEYYVPHLKLVDEVNEKTVKDLLEDIKWANEDGAKHIVLEINSPGGSVDEGFKLSKAFEESAAPIECVVDGRAASMAFYILEACDGRFMTKRSLLMGHEPAISGVVSGQPNFWLNVYKRLKYSAKALAEHITKRSKMTTRQYLKLTSGGKELWIDWEDASSYVFVDKVVDSVRSTLEDYRTHNTAKKRK